MKSIKLPFGLNEDNVFVHIADVESGKKCSCVCPDCGSPLIASKGIKNQHHFKHVAVKECEGESAVHRAAKQIIMERKRITLPRCVVSVSRRDSRGIKHTEQKVLVEDGKIINFDSVQEEKELHGVRADILAQKGDTQLIVEIFYRHKVDDQKRKKIVDANVSSIEINLSDLTPENVKDWETFWTYLNNPQHIQWLHNAKALHFNSELEKQLATKIQEQEAKYKQEAEIAEEKRMKQMSAHSLNDLRGSQSKQYSEPSSRLLLMSRPPLRRAPPPIDQVRVSPGKLKRNQNQSFGRKKFRF